MNENPNQMYEKQDLLDMIKEAKNLNETELETIPGTNVKVKKGKSAEFQVKAANFYRYHYNQFLNNNIDYVTDIYNLLEKEMNLKNQEYNMSKAYDIVKNAEENIQYFNNLQETLNTVRKNYNLKSTEYAQFIKDPANLQNTTHRQELEVELQKLAENQDIIIKRLEELRTNLNNDLINVINKELDFMHNNYLNTLNGTNWAFGMDNNAVLATDKERYDNLYVLREILKVANTKDVNSLVAINNILVVSEDQKDTVLNLLSKIDLFKNTEPIPKKEEPKRNDAILNEIENALNVIRGKVNTTLGQRLLMNAIDGSTILNEDLEEYNNLIKIKEYLIAGNFKEPVAKIWDMMYVEGLKINEFTGLLNKTNFFNKYNPNIIKQNENTNLINELISYLDTLGNKVATYNGFSNLNIKQTNALGDKAWVVTAEDLDEANRIIAIIKMLEVPNTNLINVWNIGNVASNQVSEFKNLINSTRYFSNRIPELKANEEAIEQIKEDLKELIIYARKNNLEVTLMEEYKLLDEKFNILNKAKLADNLVPYENVMLPEEDIARYQEINARLNALKNQNLNPENNNSNTEPIVIPLGTPTAEPQPSVIELGSVTPTVTPQVIPVPPTVPTPNEAYTGPVAEGEQLAVSPVKDLAVPIKNLNINNDTLINQNLVEMGKLTQKIVGYDINYYCTTIKGYTVLLQDKEELETLLFLNECLENGKEAIDYTIVNGIKLDSTQVNSYQEALAKLENIRKTPKGKIEPVMDIQEPIKAKVSVRYLIADKLEKFMANRKNIIKKGLQKNLSKIINNLKNNEVISVPNDTELEAILNEHKSEDGIESENIGRGL